ncbi:GAL4-like Zn(II)2Cys6 (or C6 zinc) binuclear cluster DNA-binding domain [Teratosphaeria destructans]|uniref:GAL4-like Zn(II)2Cys6 (Or C6 zinc) binuclear cluster DNA-binding domain n=1 Tax=Teratosphaeria destructans TaxID=418781 RepID=A0A9W7SKR4_9PEZI|nr:GAL4-like Zn(II)2Cys6 (or C6 zinc) binuclear cluster DNA-binding domain [Teratosphaeria destructans]
MQSSPQTPLPPPLYRAQQFGDGTPGMQPFWNPAAANTRGGPFDAPFDAIDTSLTGTITTFDWDEAVVDEYYRIIHQTFPLLPSSKHRLRQKLGECPASLREAFLAALDCLMRTFPTTTLPANPGYPQALKKTAELLARYPFDNPSTHTNSTNLVYLQTLIMMALESDNHGPATIRGQAGPSRAEWLGRAAGVAGQLEINVIHSGAQSIMEGDRDSDERLARRVWWVLFILDRWHASSTADLLKLPENSVVLLPEDQMLLGESTYHLARLSFIIGHLAAILTTTKTPSTDVMAPSNPASSLLGLTLAGEIDRFRESVESVWGSLNLVHLSYHHCHLLIKRLNPQTEPTELVGHAVKVATVLNSRLTPVTPLNHHFGALAAMTLCELCDSEGWDGAVREMVVGKVQKILGAEGGAAVGAGLQDLANAATGAMGLGEGFDPTMLTRYGYLTALGQGMFRGG